MPVRGRDIKTRAEARRVVEDPLKKGGPVGSLSRPRADASLRPEGWIPKAKRLPPRDKPLEQVRARAAPLQDLPWRTLSVEPLPRYEEREWKRGDPEALKHLEQLAGEVTTAIADPVRSPLARVQALDRYAVALTRSDRATREFAPYIQRIAETCAGDMAQLAMRELQTTGSIDVMGDFMRRFYLRPENSPALAELRGELERRLNDPSATVSAQLSAVAGMLRLCTPLGLDFELLKERALVLLGAQRNVIRRASLPELPAAIRDYLRVSQTFGVGPPELAPRAVIRNAVDRLAEAALHEPPKVRAERLGQAAAIGARGEYLSRLRNLALDVVERPKAAATERAKAREVVEEVDGQLRADGLTDVRLPVGARAVHGVTPRLGSDPDADLAAVTHRLFGVPLSLDAVAVAGGALPHSVVTVDASAQSNSIGLSIQHPWFRHDYWGDKGRPTTTLSVDATHVFLSWMGTSDQLAPKGAGTYATDKIVSGAEWLRSLQDEAGTPDRIDRIELWPVSDGTTVWPHLGFEPYGQSHAAITLDPGARSHRVFRAYAQSRAERSAAVEAQMIAAGGEKP